MQPNSNITINGQIVNTSGSDKIDGLNISANVTSGGSGYNITPSVGVFQFNITAPSAVGAYNVSIRTNESTPHNKTIPIYVSNVTSSSITFIGDLPPYSAGDTFIINLTFLDNESSPIQSYTPIVSVYKANGQSVSWTVLNNSPSSDTEGVITYNVSVSAEAEPGHYALIVDRGIVAGVVGVQSGYKVLVDPETANGEVTLNFAPGSPVMIMTRVKTVDDIAVSSGIEYVRAYIRMPNGTVSSLTLNAMDQTSFPGYYNDNFTFTSGSGTYEVRVDANVSGTVVEGYTLFNTRTFNTRLEPQTGFFKEWGGSSAFGANQTIALDIVATNLTDDSMFVVPTDIPSCSGDYLKLVDIFFPNGTSINSTIGDAQFITGNYFMNQICRIKFIGPSISSPYGIKVNVTVGGVTETAEGYFLIQQYFLKPTIVAGFGGEMEMMSMVAPGDNATITLSAYNITNDEAVGGSNITNVIVKKIKPMEFQVGAVDIKGSDVNYSVAYGATPTLTLTVPSYVMGPIVVEIDADVGGETVRGNTFFIANHLMGELMPSGGGGPGSGGPGGPGDGFDPFISCSGTETLAGTISEVRTAEAVGAGAVVVNSIIEAREEFTDKDVSSYITLAAGGSSDSDGKVSVNITFSGSYSFSGFYFVVFNASYQGKTAGVPAFFICKNLKFPPEIYSVGGSDTTWRIAPESGVNVIISNISRVNDSRLVRNSTAQIPMIFNFNPGNGGERILIPTSDFTTWAQSNWINWTTQGNPYNVTSNLANITIYPQNFTLGGQNLTKWPNGFIDIQPTICTESLGNTVDPSDTSTWGCDTGFGGFQVVPFDAWVEGFQWGGTTAVNTTESYIVSVKSNVSLNCTSSISCNRVTGSTFTGANNTGFKVKIGRPWEGELNELSGVLVELLSDGWNSTSQVFGIEQWNVTFTVPATTRKGEAMILISVNNSYGESIDVELWTTLTKYSISIPYTEGVSQWDGTDISCPGGYSPEIANISGISWNLTELNVTYGISSKSCEQSGNGYIAGVGSFNVTRYGESDQYSLSYNPTLRMLLMDDVTPGQFGLVVMNNSGDINWVDANNRTMSLNGYGVTGVYLLKIDGQYINVVNSSAVDDTNEYGSLSDWGGEGEISKIQLVPYVIKLGNNPIQNAEVHVNGMIEQTFEGKGFESKLTGRYDASGLTAAGENYSYITATTDSLGVAFLRVNVTSQGRFSLFWKVNTSQDYDMATFSSGTQLEMRKFKGWGEGVYETNDARVTLYNTSGLNATSVWGVFAPGVYNGTLTEMSNYGFVRDSQSDTWYFAYNDTINLTCIDDDANMTDGADSGNYNRFCLYINETTNTLEQTYGADANTQMAVSSYLNDTTGYKTLIFYQENPRPNSITASQGNPNITLKVCARSFSSPNNLPMEGANVKLYTMDYETMGPPESTWLTMYDPMNGTAYTGGGSEPQSGIFTGPSGCVAFVAAHPTGWVANKCVEIRGKITSGSDIEKVWVGRVCV
ncbi:MAG: hypothetical protein ACYTFW_06540 [Planctomycetota bacterium]